MLIRVLRLLIAPRTWRAAALLAVGVLLAAATYQLPPRASLSSGWNPPEMVGIYEVGRAGSNVFLRLSRDGSARFEVVGVLDTGHELRATVAPGRRTGRWWVEHPSQKNPLSTVLARPRLCEQWKPTRPPTCSQFERDARGHLTLGDFGLLMRRETFRYTKRTLGRAPTEVGAAHDSIGAEREGTS